MSFNRWNYVDGNPVNLTDPTGNDPWWCGELTTELEERVCVGAWFESHSSNRQKLNYNADDAENYALDHIQSLNGLENWGGEGGNCANMVSRALAAGGLVDPFGRWDPNDPYNSPAVRAGSSTEYDLFDFLSTYFKFDLFSIPGSGITLRGESRWESWNGLMGGNIRKGDVVFYKWYIDNIVPDHWSHVAIVSNPSSTETQINPNVSLTGANKPKVLELSGSLNSYCWPSDPNKWPDPASQPECSHGTNAGASAGRSIDDTGNSVSAVAIVHMQEPK